MKNPHRGSSLKDLLEADGTYEEVSSKAALRAISENLENRLERLKNDLQRFIVVTLVLVAIAQILVIKVWR